HDERPSRHLALHVSRDSLSQRDPTVRSARRRQICFHKLVHGHGPARRGPRQLSVSGHAEPRSGYGDAAALSGTVSDRRNSIWQAPPWMASIRTISSWSWLSNTRIRSAKKQSSVSISHPSATPL